MPLNIDPVQILLHLLNFVILAGGLTLLLYRPVCRFLDERRAYFERLAAENAEKAAENERLLSAYTEKMAHAQAEADELRAAAEKESAAAARVCLESAQKKADALIAAAEKEAVERKEHILDSVQTEIGELVLSATQKLLSETVTPERNSELYDEFIRLADKTVSDERTTE